MTRTMGQVPSGDSTLPFLFTKARPSERACVCRAGPTGEGPVQDLPGVDHAQTDQTHRKVLPPPAIFSVVHLRRARVEALLSCLPVFAPTCCVLRLGLSLIRQVLLQTLLVVVCLTFRHDIAETSVMFHAHSSNLCGCAAKKQHKTQRPGAPSTVASSSHANFHELRSNGRLLALQHECTSTK